jgi:hypothetical protein
VALDRFVYWQTDARPTREQLQIVLEDFIGGAGSVNWDVDRFFVLLHGKHSEAYRRCDRASETQRLYAQERHEEQWERWIEVWVRDEPLEIEAEEEEGDPGGPLPLPNGTHSDKGCVDVMTRSADDFTNGVAARLAEVLARFWDGKVEAG